MEIINKKQANEKALKYYFTGKPCKKEHISERRVDTGACRQCMIVNAHSWRINNSIRVKENNEKYWKEYYNQNVKRIRENSRIWYNNNTEHAIQLVTAWQQINPEKVKQINRAWYQNNITKAKEYGKQWRLTNLEQAKENGRRWNKNNPDKKQALNAKRNASKIQAIPKWANLKKISEFYTEAALMTKVTGEQHDVDHIIPLQGKTICGLHCEDNLQVILHVENCKKGNKILEKYT